METYSGHLSKMIVEIGDPVAYQLPLDELRIPLNSHLGKHVKFEFSGAIHCVSCGRKTKKSYSQGHCYPCTMTLASCDMCILKPELCHYDKGTCREPQWGEKHCLKSHYVYLANSSGLKVGITRGANVPTRWIDQGALQAIPILKVDQRLHSGLLEVAFKKHVSDRTNWRAMLKGDVSSMDLCAERDRLLEVCSDDIQQLRQQFGKQAIEILTEEEVVLIDYPVLKFPQKIISKNFDKTPVVEGVLEGIKGQYLLLSTGVLNIRKFSGYQVELSL